MHLFQDHIVSHSVKWWIILIFSATLGRSQDCAMIYEYIHPVEYNPQIYHAHLIDETLKIDGKLNEASWSQAHYSLDFQDIEGEKRARPEQRTRIKMLWDSTYLYIGAMLEEDHLWATLTRKDDIIYRDDDFEVFIDANGDGNHYQEIEINAFNTVMDLWMKEPYHTGGRGKYIMEWEGKGVKSAVHLVGTINQPGDTDEYWSIEMAIPIKLVGNLRDFWRINFSRVDWPMEISNNKYVKKRGESERNWVWSPTGVVDMHRPETWGYVFFNKDGLISDLEAFKWKLWSTYHSVRAYRRNHKVYPSNLECIKSQDDFWIESSQVGFDLYGTFQGETWMINENAKISKLR